MKGGHTFRSIRANQSARSCPNVLEIQFSETKEKTIDSNSNSQSVSHNQFCWLRRGAPRRNEFCRRRSSLREGPSAEEGGRADAAVVGLEAGALAPNTRAADGPLPPQLPLQRRGDEELRRNVLHHQGALPRVLRQQEPAKQSPRFAGDIPGRPLAQTYALEHQGHVLQAGRHGSGHLLHLHLRQVLRHVGLADVAAGRADRGRDTPLRLQGDHHEPLLPDKRVAPEEVLRLFSRRHAGTHRGHSRHQRPLLHRQIPGVDQTPDEEGALRPYHPPYGRPRRIAQSRPSGMHRLRLRGFPAPPGRAARKVAEEHAGTRRLFRAGRADGGGRVEARRQAEERRGPVRVGRLV